MVGNALPFQFDRLPATEVCAAAQLGVIANELVVLLPKHVPYRFGYTLTCKTRDHTETSSVWVRHDQKLYVGVRLLGVTHAHIEFANIVLENKEAGEERAGDEAAAAGELRSRQHQGRWTDAKRIAENRRSYNIELELTLRELACGSRELRVRSSSLSRSNDGPSCSSTRRYSQRTCRIGSQACTFRLWIHADMQDGRTYSDLLSLGKTRSEVLDWRQTVGRGVCTHSARGILSQERKRPERKERATTPRPQ